LNAPWWLSAAYKVAYLFIDSTTRAKVKWIYGSSEEIANQLKSHISLSELEERYGGTSKREFVATPQPEPVNNDSPTEKPEQQENVDEKKDVNDLD
jgi:hypothetical protein